MRLKLFFLAIFLLNFLQAETNLRYGANIKGNVKVIGNSILIDSDDELSNCGNEYKNLKYIDIDDDDTTFNSSSATINNILDGINVDKSKIVWAGLYWTGYIHNDNKDIGIDDVFSDLTIDDSIEETKRKIENYIDNQTILLKIDDGDYIEIKPTKVDKIRKFEEIETNPMFVYSPKYVAYMYSAFADITDILKDKSINHKFTVAKLTTRSGLVASGAFREGDPRDPYAQNLESVGNYGGWALVVVYDNSMELQEKVRHLSIYDGFSEVKAGTQFKLKLTDFKTPSTAPNGVDAELSFFTAEGDRLNLLCKTRNEDRLYLTNQENRTYELLSDVQGDFFASVIDGVLNREPLLEDNVGIDIHINKVGTTVAENMPIDVNQTEATITFDSISDDYLPIVVAFSSELYTPEICYDYDVKLGDEIDIPSVSRDIVISDNLGKPLSLGIMLRNQDKTYSLEDSKIRVEFNPADKLSYIKNSALYSPPDVYDYFPAVEINSDIGEIAVGNDPTTEGGTLPVEGVSYSKLYYNFNENSFKGNFNLYFETKISFDGVNKIPYSYSTAVPAGSKGYIPRCPSSSIYDPTYGMFNIERGDSTFLSADASDEERYSQYSLYTQVVGKPYQISIASYQKDDSGNYTLPNKISTTLELEMIRGDSFSNSADAGFDAICREPISLSKGVFVKLDETDRVKVNIPEDFPTYPDEIALSNAIFRVWILTKASETSAEREIVTHECKNQEDSQCFKELYNTHYLKEDNDTKYCYDICNADTTEDSGCYSCLKRHFSMPICSRDNFAIRPKVLYTKLLDDNETDPNAQKLPIIDSFSSNKADLSAGYLYRFEVNSTSYNNKVGGVTNYHFNALGVEANRKATIEFKSQEEFKDACVDKVDKLINIALYGGSSIYYEPLDSDNSTNLNIPPINGLIINNTGDYQITLEDREWTKVDLKENKKYQTSSDCVEDSNEISDDPLKKNGCIISNEYKDEYKKLNITMHPYKFDLSSVGVYTTPNSNNLEYLYINNLEDTADLIKSGSVMAVKIHGDVVAKGKNGADLTNYRYGCNAYNLDSKIEYTTTDLEDDSLKLQYSFFNSDIDDSVTVEEATSKNSIEILFKNRYFYIPSTGRYTTYLNFKREYDRAINPFKITVDKLSVISNDETIFVDLNSSYKPSGDVKLDANRTLYYVKAKSKKSLYDDVIESNITTPVEVAIFCNRDLEYCKKYGIDIEVYSTNEYDWWRFKHHKAVEGKILLQTSPEDKSVISPSVVDSFENGLNSGVEVNVTSSTRPITIFVQPTVEMVKNFPWMLFNKNGNSVAEYLYKVRFISPPINWSGEGKTGHTIDTRTEGKKSKKVGW